MVGLLIGKCRAVEKRADLGQADFSGDAGQACGIAAAGFLADGTSMALHGAYRDVQLSGDLLVQLACCNGRQNLSFTVGQIVGGPQN